MQFQPNIFPLRIIKMLSYMGEPYHITFRLTLNIKMHAKYKINRNWIIFVGKPVAFLYKISTKPILKCLIIPFYNLLCDVVHPVAFVKTSFI